MDKISVRRNGANKMDHLTITRMDSEQLSYKTKMALMEIIRINGADGRPFKLPNEDELSQRLGVSRNVLRDALMSLEEVGVVTRRRNKGTIANPAIATATCRLDTNPELFRMIQDAGYRARSENVRLGFVSQPEPTLEGDCYLNVEKIFYADDRPVAYCADHISGKFIPPGARDTAQLADLSHYKFMEACCSVSMAYTMAHIDAALPEPWLAQAMDLEPQEPVLLMDDFAYSYDHALVAHSTIWFKRGVLDLKFLRKSW